MQHKPILKFALVVAALSSGLAAGQDVRREDRQADRQADRPVDRQADRRADAPQAPEAEVRLALPRNADGTVNESALTAEIRSRLAAGATELQFRGLTGQDVARLFLDAKDTLLADLGALLPNDGVERSVRLRGAVDARVQRNDEGELRARIENIDLGTLTPQQRADLARQLASEAGLDRLRIRGTDAKGNRVRLEFRDGVLRNETRGNSGPGRGERIARADRPERAERAERAERPERAERAERVERAERPERSGNSGRH